MNNGVSKKLGSGGHAQESYDTTTGKYVSENESLSNQKIQSNNLHLKSNISIDINGFKSKQLEKENSVPTFSNVLEAQNYANQILLKLQSDVTKGYNSLPVKYSKKCDIRSAQELTESLNSISKDFPKLMKNLLNYSDTSSSGKNIDYSKVSGIINSVFEKHLKHNDSNNSFDWQENTMSKFLLNLNSYVQIGFEKMSHKIGVTASTFYASDKFHDIKLPINCITFKQKYTSEYNYFKFIRSDPANMNYGDAYGKPGPLYATATHELGHFIHNNLDYFGFKGLEKTYLLHEYNEMKKSNELSQQTSKYAKTSFEEMTAEAVSDWYCNKEHASEFNKKIFNFLKKVYDREFEGKQ